MPLAVEFTGRGSEEVARRAHLRGLGDLVTVQQQVSAAEARAKMTSADALLLLAGADDKQVGVVTAKIFEYLSVRRPILLFGRSDGVAADIIRETDSGSVAADPTALADALVRLALVLRESGHIPSIAKPLPPRLLRSQQVRELEDILDKFATRSRTVD